MIHRIFINIPFSASSFVEDNGGLPSLSFSWDRGPGFPDTELSINVSFPNMTTAKFRTNLANVPTAFLSAASYFSLRSQIFLPK